MYLRIGKKVQLQNGYNYKCKMKNRNKGPITKSQLENENPITK